MNDHFSPDVLASAPGLSSRQQRQSAAEVAAACGLPSTEAEDWRYSPIGDLPLAELSPILEAPDSATVANDFTTVVPSGQRAATVTVIDGFTVDVAIDPGWSAKGLTISIDDQREATVDDGEPTVFEHLHRAFSPSALVISTKSGLAVDQPVVIVNHQQTSQSMVFPHVVVECADSSELQVVELQTATTGTAAAVPVVELDVGAAARLSYLTVQVAGSEFWSVGRQRSAVGSQATLTTGIAAFGARYARVRTDSRLVGRGANANLIAAYYGDGDQVHDFRTFQHHDARDTRSDLLFKGVQDDSSGSIYTGMIHIHPEGAGSNAFQTNRNIKLSDDAWAWSVPNLEIENNDVRCSHASTVSPVDDEQRFYLGARGVPPGPADRLIVAGFFNEVIGRMPVSVVRPELQRLIAAKLDHRRVDV